MRAFAMTCGGQPFAKSVLLSSQVSLVPIYRPRRVEGLVGPRAEIEPVSDLVIAAPHTTTPLVPTSIDNIGNFEKLTLGGEVEKL